MKRPVCKQGITKEAYQAFDIKMGKCVLNVMHADCDLLGCYTA
jgi:hypothetical protein